MLSSQNQSPAVADAADESDDEREPVMTAREIRIAARDEPMPPPFTYRDPETGERKKQRHEVISPLTGKTIIRKEPDGSTTKLPDGPCPACVNYIADKGETHALDPIFFWGAGIFDYDSLQTPRGRKAFLNDNAMGRFIKSLPYEEKRSWEDVVGLPFPFNYMRN